MDFDRESLKRDRLLRDQQRKEALAQQKKLLLRLGIAGAVLLAAAVLILVLTLGGNSNDGSEITVPETAQTGAASATEETQGAATVVHFAAAGDLNVTEKVVASGGLIYDYTRAFLDVMPLLAEADLAALNFEGCASGSDYGADCAPPQLLSALRTAGVDILQLANSRTLTRGFAGMQATLQSVKNAGLTPSGVFADSSDFRQSGGFTLHNVKGVKIALVSFTKGMDGMALPAGSEDCVNLLYTDYSSSYKKVNTDGITQVLKNARAAKPDLVIAMVHWGSEYNDTHSDSQEKIKKLLLEQGVDAVIGTHPHYVQSLEFDEAAGTLVAWSLGDFFGDGERSGTEYSVVLDLEITKDNRTGETKITGYTANPIFTAPDSQGLLRVLRLDTAIAAYEANHYDRVAPEMYDKMLYAKDRVVARLTPAKDKDQ